MSLPLSFLKEYPSASTFLNYTLVSQSSHRFNWGICHEKCNSYRTDPSQTVTLTTMALQLVGDVICLSCTGLKFTALDQEGGNLPSRLFTIQASSEKKSTLNPSKIWKGRKKKRNEDSFITSPSFSLMYIPGSSLYWDRESTVNPQWKGCLNGTQRDTGWLFSPTDRTAKIVVCVKQSLYKT